MTLKPRLNPRDDLVVVGHPFAPIGMGEHVRATWRSLKAAGSTLPLLDLFSLQRHKDSDLERELGPHVTEHLSRRINLFCINADEVEPAMNWLDTGRFDKAYKRLGFERLLMFVTGVSNIRDVIPFARTPGHAPY